jgi:hypothetical protein
MGYLQQIRMTISRTGAAEPEDLTPETRAELTDLCQRRRDE